MKYPGFAFCLLFGLSVVRSSLIAEEPYWPMFHGAKQDNRSTDTGLLTEWPEGAPTLLWTVKLPGEGVSGYSTVSIANNKLYTTGNVEDQSYVFCYDLDGHPIWSAENGMGWINKRYFPGTRSTPTIFGEYLYNLSAVGQMTCFEAKTGEKIWSRNILSDFEGENVTWALAESPLVDEKYVYCCPGGKKASIVALDKKTGKTVWATPSTDEKTSYATARIIEQDGLSILVTMYAKGLLGVNAKTGEKLFTFKLIQTYDINAVTPIYHDGHLFIANCLDNKPDPEKEPDSGAKLLKLTVKGDKASVEEVWWNPELDNLHNSVVLLDGYLYGSAHNMRGGSWVCVRWSDGKTLWNQRDISRGSLTFADGHLIRVTEIDRNVALVKPSPEKYDVVSRFQLPEQGEGMTWAHPVVCGGRLYLRHGVYLYCYQLKK